MYNNDGLIFKNFIKYEELMALLKDDGNKFYNKDVNIFIDADSLYESYINTACMDSDNLNPIHISSTILNMIGHYKHFFNRICFSKTIKVIVLASTLPVDIAKKICDYINDVYIIQQDDDGSDNIIKIYNYTKIKYRNIQFEKTLSFVITGDRYYCYQLPALDPNISVLRIYTNTNGYKYINSNTCLDDFNPKIKKYNPDINASMISLITAYSNSKALGLYTQYNIAKTIKKLTEYIDLGIIVNGYNYPYSIRDILIKDTIQNDRNETILNRYIKCDIISQVRIKDRIINDSSWIINKYASYESIAKVFDIYFNDIENMVNIHFLVFG